MSAIDYILTRFLSLDSSAGYVRGRHARISEQLISLDGKTQIQRVLEIRDQHQWSWHGIAGFRALDGVLYVNLLSTELHPLTRDRAKRILNKLPGVRISTRKGILRLNGVPWEGNKSPVLSTQIVQPV